MNLCLSKSIKTVPLPKKYIEIKSIASSSINFLIVIGHSTDHETSRIARMLMAPGILRKFIDFSVHREIRNVAYHNKCAVLTIVNPSFYTMTDYPVTDLLYEDGICYGVRLVHDDKDRIIYANNTIIASLKEFT